MTEGHPGSTGWAAFEARMRNRRFSRCIEHATAGLQSGAMEEVRDALDEARILCPDAPEIVELESRIAALPSPSAVLLASNMSVQEPPAGWLRVIGAMCVLVLLFGMFGFGLAQLYLNAPTTLLTDGGTTSTPAAPAVAPDVSPAPKPSAETQTADARAAATPPKPEAEPEPQPQLERQPVPEPPAPRAIGTTSSPAAEEKPALVEPPRRREPPASQALPSPGRAESSAASTTRPTPAPEPPPAVPDRPVSIAELPPVVPAVSRANAPVTDPVLPLESPILSPSAAPPRAVPASTASAPREPMPAMSGDESTQIRLLLSRYETAYNRLDATAASSVYPRIDRAALDRAFKGLISQRVSLGLCDITVVGDIGGASCAGKARWEPRVGGGLQTADRYWTFNLRKSTEGWRIEQIRVRE
jgi:hypothetical protein